MSTSSACRVPESVKRGLDFIHSSASFFHYTNLNSVCLQLHHSSLSSVSDDPQQQMQILANFTQYLDLFSILDSFSDASLLSLKRSIKQALVLLLQSKPKMDQINDFLHHLHKLAATRNRDELDTYTAVNVTWVLVREGLISKQFAQKIVELILSTLDEGQQISSFSSTMQKHALPSDSDARISSSGWRLKSSRKRSWQWQPESGICQQDPVTSANILRLAYQIQFNEQSSCCSKLELIEAHLHKILANKSYSTASPDLFLHTVSNAICLCTSSRVREKFLPLLVKCVQDREREIEIECNERENQQAAAAAPVCASGPVPLDIAYRILTQERLQLLQSAKIRNKLSPAFNALLELQCTDGSWPCLSVDAGVNSQNNSNWSLTTMTTVYVIKAIHAFNERRIEAMSWSRESQHNIA